MARKDKKPEIPPPSPSSSSATSSSSDATSTDSPPPKTNTIRNSPNTVTPSEQDDTASSSDADTDVSTPKTNTTANKPDTVSSSAASDDSDSDSSPPKQQQPVSTSKRPAENHTATTGSVPEKKKPKKENVVISALPTTNVDKRATETGGTAMATPHKQLFQRIWSDEDEIVILKGMIDYKANKRTDPMSNVDDFLDFIKKSLKVADANKGQVVNKVKRLKTKFRNAKKKKTLTNPHEIETFKLSKLIWGDEIEAEDAKVEKDEGWVIRKCEDVGEGEGIDVAFGFSGEDEVILKEAMKVMEGNEKMELKKKAKSASLAYVEAYLMRLKVMQFAAQKVLDDLKES